MIESTYAIQLSLTIDFVVVIALVNGNQMFQNPGYFHSHCHDAVVAVVVGVVVVAAVGIEVGPS